MNKEEVLFKIKNGILSYKELDDELKNDKEITAIAFAKDKKLIKVINQDYLNDEEFLKILINENVRRSELITPELLLKKDFMKYFFDNKYNFFKRIDEKYQEQVAALFSEEEKQAMCFRGNMDLKYIDISKVSDEFIIACIDDFNGYGLSIDIIKYLSDKQLGRNKILDELFKYTGSKERVSVMSDSMKTSPILLKSLIKHQKWIAIASLPDEAFSNNPELAAEILSYSNSKEYIEKDKLEYIKKCSKNSTKKASKTDIKTKQTSNNISSEYSANDKIVMMEIGSEKKKQVY